MSSTEHLDRTFAALADPTRRAILGRLASGDASLKDLARPFDMSLPAVSKHVKVLEEAGLVSRSRDAQRRPARLRAERLGEAADWLDRFRDYWEQSYVKLDQILETCKAQQRRGETQA